MAEEDNNNSPVSSSSLSTLERSRSHLGFGPSYSDCEILDDTIIINDVAEIEPTAALLDYSKRRFQRPFVIILGLAGLKPMTTETDWTTYLGHVQTMIILIFSILGYVLQFITGFRRDRGFASEVPSKLSQQDDELIYFHYKRYFETGEIVFTYAIPATLHLIGLIFAIYVYRIADNEQFQSLIEKVFILSNNTKRLIISFWIYKTLALTWLILSVMYIVFLGMAQGDMARNHYMPFAKGIDQKYLRIVLYVCLSVHDFIQVIIVSSYCVNCFMLRCYLNSLKEKLLHHTIQPLEWMREICGFRKHLHHLNTKICIPVCCMGVLNLSYTFSSIIHLFTKMDTCPVTIFSMNLANIVLYIIITLVPFIQAAALSVSCRAIQSCGHLVSIRPFVHRNTSSEDLNTILLYASSLNMTAKLYRMPIIVHYLCFILLVIVIIVLTFGMCINISLGIF